MVYFGTWSATGFRPSSNMFTNLNLTEMETGYKHRAAPIKSIQIKKISRR